MEVANQMYSIRRDALNRWIVQTEDWRSRIIVEVWSTTLKSFLSVYITQPVSASALANTFVNSQILLSGLCVFQSTIPSRPVGIDQSRMSNPPLSCHVASIASLASPSDTSGSAIDPSIANQQILSLLEVDATVGPQYLSDDGPEYSHVVEDFHVLTPSDHGNSRFLDAGIANRVKLAAASVRVSANGACATDALAANAAVVCGASANTETFDSCVRDVCLFPDQKTGFANAYANAAVTLTALRHGVSLLNEETLHDDLAAQRLAKNAAVMACPL